MSEQDLQMVLETIELWRTRIVKKVETWTPQQTWIGGEGGDA